MSSFDPATLPAPLADYFAATNHGATAQYFASDAVVRDERATHIGSAAIARWLTGVETRYRPRYEVTSAETRDDHTVVSFIVSGNFPGSPARLRQEFTTANGKIRALRTL